MRAPFPARFSVTTRLRLLVAVLSLLFLGLHLRALPQTLEDIDSINFALGVEHFDIARHQPHPPGYPVFIGLAKISTRAVGAVAPSWSRDHRAAAGLALWGVVAGAAAAFVIAEFWMAAGLAPGVAVMASILAVLSPLFWFTAARPLTDTLGIVAALAVQTWFIRGLRAWREGSAELPRDWIWAAVFAGVIVGVRSQSVWLVWPLFAWALGELIARRRWADAAALAGAAAVGVLAWAVPVLWRSGGVTGYLTAIRSQGAEDLANIELLATKPTWTLLQAALKRTFLVPWESLTLGRVVVLLALAGAVRLALRGPRVLIVICFAFWPYLVFHLMFQETVTIRYALPMVVPVAGLAVVGLAWLGLRAAAVGTTLIAVSSLVLAQPRLQAYSAAGSPVFRAFQAMQAARPPADLPPLVAMHHQVWWGVQRAIEWYRPVWDVGPQPFPGDHEWLDVVQHFRHGSARPVWFLAHLPRTDLAAFDPRTTTEAGRYVLPESLRTLIGGGRLDSLGWWRLERPGWMLGQGWALTPELAGRAAADREGPEVNGAAAFIRRFPGPATVMIGGRYLGDEAGPAAVVTATLEGRVVDQWRVSAAPRWFVHWIPLPDGVPDGDDLYARLVVTAAGEGGASPRVGLEQFDAAPDDQFLYALADGWNELEDNPVAALQWRWTTARSAIVVRNTHDDLVLEIAGESPLKSFPTPPRVTVKAGDQPLATFSPQEDFSERIALPAAALQQAGGRVTIETNETFRPSDKGSVDHRELGLRLYSIRITRPSSQPRP